LLIGPGYDFQCSSRAFPGTGPAGDAFNRHLIFGMLYEIIGGASSSAGVTGVTQFFVQHNHPWFVNGQGILRAYFHAGAALVTNTEFKIIVPLGMHPDTGFLRDIFLKIEVGTNRHTGIAANAIFIDRFKVFHCY
jgi:hypothetical protein